MSEDETDFNEDDFKNRDQKMLVWLVKKLKPLAENEEVFKPSQYAKLIDHAEKLKAIWGYLGGASIRFEVHELLALHSLFLAVNQENSGNESDG